MADGEGSMPAAEETASPASPWGNPPMLVSAVQGGGTAPGEPAGPGFSPAIPLAARPYLSRQVIPGAVGEGGLTGKAGQAREAGPVGEAGQAGGPAVYGHVRRADGAPIAGATVTLIDMSGRQAGHGRAGSDGSYQIPVAGQQSYTLIGMGQGHQPNASAVYVGSQPVEHQVLLSGGSRLSGSVRRAGSGEPLAGATVALADAHGEIIAASATDPAGRYSFEEVAPGGYTLAISSPSCQPTALRVTIAERSETVQDVELKAAGRLEGTTTTKGGRAVPDARVTLLDHDGNMLASATTGVDGRYSFENLREGDYTVIASGYPPAAERLRIVAGQYQQHDVQLSYPEA